MKSLEEPHVYTLRSPYFIVWNAYLDLLLWQTTLVVGFFNVRLLIESDRAEAATTIMTARNEGNSGIVGFVCEGVEDIVWVGVGI